MRVAEGLILRRRPGGLRERGRQGLRAPGRRLGLGTLAAPATAPAAGAWALDGAGATRPPRLGLRDPEDSRNTWLSGAAAFVFHAALVAAVVVAGWMAPDVIEETLIPVTILQPQPEAETVELPGSNDPSPGGGGGPKEIAARTPASAAALAAAMAAAPPPSAVDAPQELSAVQAARSPVALDRSALEAAAVEAEREAAPAPRPLDVAALSPSPVAVDPGDLSAPRLDFRAPKAIDTRAPSAVTAPEAFAGYQDVDPSAYRGQAAAVGVPSGVTGGGPTAGQGIETGLSGAYLGGGDGGGGVGSGSGVGRPTVECLRSGYVRRYLDLIDQRTKARWVIPEEAGDLESVVLSFRLDVTGSVTRVDIVEAGSEPLGRSAVQALRTAAPFPPMDENIRCLSEKTLTGTFTAGVE